MTGLIILIVVMDRIAKFLAALFLKDQMSYGLWPNVFHLTYTENTGAAFSILSSHTTLLAVFSFIMVVGLSYYLHRRKKEEASLLEQISLAFIIGGAIGNLYDRAILGYVIDFFDFRLINFAVFNVADSFITVGAILLVLSLILDEKKKKHQHHTTTQN